MQPFPKSEVKYLIQVIAPHKKAFFFSMLLILMESLGGNASTWFFARFVECVKQAPNQGNLDAILTVLALIAMIMVFMVWLPKKVLMYRQKNLYFPVQEDIYHRALNYIFGHSVNYIINKQTGTLLAKTNQINNMQPILGMLLSEYWELICNMTIKIALLTIINGWLGLLFFVLCVLVAVVNYYANKPSERLSKMEKKSESLYTGWLVDAIANIRLVKQFNRLKYEETRLAVLLKQFLEIKKKVMIVWFNSYTGVGCFVHVCSISLLGLAVYLWSISKVDVGDIVFVLMTISRGFMWLMELCVLYRRFINVLAGVRSGLEPFVDVHEIIDGANAKKLKVRKAEIEFKDVVFAYPNRDKLFNGFNLKIKDGEKVGIVGLSGNGKTTLINLLQRAYEIQSGKILIDGQDIKKVTQQSLHRAMAIIPQEAVLFHRSIRDNIAYGISTVNDKEVMKAAKTACADKFIDELPQGYQSMVGDRGCKLSGGEKQRVVIARAVLRNSPILILDEATSSLDSESEYWVAKAIDNLLGRRTVIAIAHRLSTLKGMDRIVYLENGKIVEEGTFAELTKKKNGKFAHLWRLQQMEAKA